MFTKIEYYTIHINGYRLRFVLLLYENKTMASKNIGLRILTKHQAKICGVAILSNDIWCNEIRLRFFLVFYLTLWTRGGPKTDPQSLVTKPQVIEYQKLYRSEEPEGDGRASTDSI